MSYILEALKKAEAQRGQGQVPGLHDQHMAPEFSGGATREGQSLLIWIIMAMGLMLMALLVWALWQPDPAGNAAAPPTLTSPPAVLAPVARPAAPTEPKPQPETATTLLAQTPPASPPTMPLRNERKAHAENTEATKPQQARHKQPAPADELPELPEAMRPQLPKLTFGGAMHSDNPASRMLIVNGQLLHEGDAISPDLTLEHIQLKQATFRYKGYRYTAQY